MKLIFYQPVFAHSVGELFRIRYGTNIITRLNANLFALSHGMKVESLKKALRGVKDPRRTECGNIRHKLEDILRIGLCTFVCNGEDFENMEEFGKEREEFLKGFLELPNGIPDSDTFRRVFERVNPQALSEALYGWLEAVRPEGPVIAVDGKTIRGSGNGAHKAYHVVSAFVAESRITLGELAVDEKSNEITAVPELLKFLDIENSVVTADAMSCQAEIVRTIVNGKADYVIAANLGDARCRKLTSPTALRKKSGRTTANAPCITWRTSRRHHPQGNLSARIRRRWSAGAVSGNREIERTGGLAGKTAERAYECDDAVTRRVVEKITVVDADTIRIRIRDSAAEIEARFPAQ